MIKPEQVPLEVMQAYYDALAETSLGTAAIAAAISAWPGMEHMTGETGSATQDGEREHIILPLTETPNE